MPLTTRGMYNDLLGIKHIFINSNLSEEAQKVVLCHELGHVILHPELYDACMLNTRQIPRAKNERQSNFFALYYLSHSSVNDVEAYESALYRADLNESDIHNLLIRFSLFEPA